ncbi:hypothetical protein QUF80_16410 [Desulfococcaceae bacterium HSG8]|nr:hypothetical protein [Desulfococcaceae bacterium HSG8]
MKNDLIALFCKGEGKRFRGERCEHYEIFTDECRLLRDRKMKDVFEKGRCEPCVMVERAVKWNFYRYKDRVNPEEYTEVWEICEAIKKHTLHIPKLPVLIGYINRSVYTEAIRILIEIGILVRGICDNCVHLSLSKVYVCTRAYVLVDGKEIENPLYDKKRNPSDKACKDGFEPYDFKSLDTDDIDPPAVTDPGEEFLIIESMKKLLVLRTDRAKDETTKKIYERQYVIFCRFVNLVREGHSDKKALKAIAKKLGVSVKTVERDMEEVRKFLKKEMSSDA